MHNGLSDIRPRYRNDNIIRTSQAYISDIIHDNKETYFITITIKPKFYKYTSVTQFELSNGEVVGIFNTLTKDYIVVPEHTKAGNIHYHAVVTFREDTQRISFINKLKKNSTLGFVKFDTNEIRNSLKVMEYMTKDLYETLKILPVQLRHKIVSTMQSSRDVDLAVWATEDNYNDELN